MLWPGEITCRVPSNVTSVRNSVVVERGRRISIQANHFENNRNVAILFANAGRQTESIIIQNNRSLNDRTFVAFFNVQNAQVVGNRTNDNFDADDDGSTIFVGGLSNGILIQRNVLVNPEFAGIAVRDSLGPIGSTANVDVLGNTITGAEGSGIDVSAERFAVVSVRNNTVRNNGVQSFPPTDGILFATNTKGNQIRGNTARGNFPFDCEDMSSGSGTAGTANTWVGNNGVTDSPNGICP
jgi:hypothetical protein